MPPPHGVRMVTGDDVDLYKLPIPMSSIFDGGPMITAGVVIARDPELPLFDLRIEEFLDAAALQANQVIVVTALVELEHRFARLEMVADQQPRLLELRQHAVHRRQADVDTVGQQLLVDILGGQMPDLALLEQVDDPQPRQRRLETGILEVVRRRHGDGRGAAGG